MPVNEFFYGSWDEYKRKYRCHICSAPPKSPYTVETGYDPVTEGPSGSDWHSPRSDRVYSHNVGIGVCKECGQYTCGNCLNQISMGYIICDWCLPEWLKHNPGYTFTKRLV